MSPHLPPPLQSPRLCRRDSPTQACCTHALPLLPLQYGPSIYVFSTKGIFERAFTMPEELKPRDAAGKLAYIEVAKGSAGYPDGAKAVTGRVVSALLAG